MQSYAGCASGGWCPTPAASGRRSPWGGVPSSLPGIETGRERRSGRWQQPPSGTDSVGPALPNTQTFSATQVRGSGDRGRRGVRERWGRCRVPRTCAPARAGRTHPAVELAVRHDPGGRAGAPSSLRDAGSGLRAALRALSPRPAQPSRTGPGSSTLLPRPDRPAGADACSLRPGDLYSLGGGGGAGAAGGRGEGAALPAQV